MRTHSLRSRASRPVLGLALALIATVSLLAAALARADVRPPVGVELVGPPRAARAGEPFTGQLRIASARPAALADLRLAGAGWRQVDLRAPANPTVDKGAGLVVDFTATPTDPSEWLVLRFLWNGVPVEKRLDLSEAGVRRASLPGAVTLVPGSDEGILPVDAGAARPAPAPLEAVADKGGDLPGDEREQPGAVGAKSRSIRVRGRFVYHRPSDGEQIGVDGMTVRIYDDDPVGDDHLTDTVTGWDGTFDVTFTFDDDWEDYPDIYVRFRAANAEHEVQHATWGYVYEWETGVHRDIASYLNIGVIQSGEEDVEPALHILTDVSRTWRWLHDLGYNCRFVDVQWPDGDEGAWYEDYYEDIHVGRDREWSEGTHSHEYGHHWINCYSELQETDYCNGYCDDDEPWDCGHCLWCRENVHDAWDEGFPDYLGYAIPQGYETRYGLAAWSKTEVAGLDTCGQDNIIHDPDITEGFVAACLLDLADDTNDPHPIFAGHSDPTALGAAAVLDAIDDTHPGDINSYLLTIKSRFPSQRYNLWETCQNCGYEIDTDVPGAVTGLYSSTHSTGTPSPDPTASFHWTHASDDASGIAGYSVSVTTTWPAMPNTSMDIGYENDYETAVLAPNTYYFNVRACDRAGRWATTYTSYGPFTVRAAERADLELYKRTGWDFTLVPSAKSTNTLASCTVSDTLPGNTAGTRWSIAGRNAGESEAAATVYGAIYTDNNWRADESYDTPASGEEFYKLNRGPINVSGGRHTLHYKIDSGDDNAEPDETDNTFGHQFVWSPRRLTAGTIYSTNGVRNNMAGWDFVTDGSSRFYNCHGLRFANSGWWNVVVVWGESETENFDIRLHLASTGAQNGFAASLRTCYRPAGCLDAVLVNRNSVATPFYDVGVIWYGTNYSGTYNALHLEEEGASFDEQIVTDMGPDNWLRLYEFDISAGDVGPVSVFVTTNPPFANLHAQWRATDFIHGSLLTCDAEAVTDEDGRAHLQFNATESGYNSLLLYRDPKDGDEEIEVRFTIMNTPPDFEPYHAAGWHSPMTPRPAADGTPASVALPDTLHGNAAATYYNLALWNDSPAAAESLRVYMYLDGASGAGILYPSFPGYASSRFNWTAAQTVRGGRHTLAWFADAFQKIYEMSEANNFYGEQYVWSPYPLSPGGLQTRVAPPARDGGFKLVNSGEPLWYNCDGLRMDGLTSYWAGLAVMPGDTSNVDVRLHEPQPGAKNGFRSNLAYSGWGAGQSDFVIANFNVASRHAYDAGVLNVSGEQPYSAHCAKETYISKVEGEHGPYSLGPGLILALYEMRLTPGPWAFQLVDRNHQVDLGFSLHPADQGFIRKSLTVENGAGWLNPLGHDEGFGVEIPATGYYCLAVWKVCREGLAKTSEYSFIVRQGVTGADDPAPAPRVTALQSVHPNPFNPRATIAFSLAEESAVEVAVYDVTGSRVRTLVRERRPAGAHTAVWDGCDEGGRRLASGVYFCRMTAGSYRETRRLTLVK